MSTRLPNEWYRYCFEALEVPPKDHNAKAKPKEDPKMRYHACKMPNCNYGVWDTLSNGYQFAKQHIMGNKHRDQYPAWKEDIDAGANGGAADQKLIKWVDNDSKRIFQWMDLYSKKPGIPLCWMEASDWYCQIDPLDRPRHF